MSAFWQSNVNLSSLVGRRPQLFFSEDRPGAQVFLFPNSISVFKAKTSDGSLPDILENWLCWDCYSALPKSEK